MRPTCEPSKAELEESLSLPQLSLQEAARRLVRPVEIHYIDRPKLESLSGWATFASDLTDAPEGSEHDNPIDRTDMHDRIAVGKHRSGAIR